MKQGAQPHRTLWGVMGSEMRSRTGGRRPWLWTLLLAMLLLSMVLSACGADASQQQAQQNKAKLDQELTHARNDLGIPDSLLQPVVTQEQKVSSGEGGLFYNYSDAAANYTLLYNQLIGIEQSSGDLLKQQTQADLDAFTQILAKRRADGFIEADQYQARLDQALQDYDQAKTPGDYARIDAIATANTAALNAMWPAYEKLQAYKTVLDALAKSGADTTLAQSQYDSDLEQFRNAQSADRYDALTRTIDGQITQLIAEEASAQPYIASGLLEAFQARIDLLRQYGDTANADMFQKQHDDDAAALAKAHQLADYLTLANNVNKQSDAIAFPLVKAKTLYDLQTLKQLVATVNKRTEYNSYDKTNYPIAYEYSDKDNGVGNIEPAVLRARTIAQYQAADGGVLGLTANLRAMSDNYDDKTPHNQPHQADLTLMQYYNVMQGKVVIVNFREQTARFYENGSLVNWMYVTTGRPGHTSIPGYHTALAKVSPTIFNSPFPEGSPDYYAPTPINFAVAYDWNGYFLHDAWWRNKFGPGTEYPHYDPAAFNGGSHGCINFSEAQMSWVYSWIPLRTPIIMY